MGKQSELRAYEEQFCLLDTPTGRLSYYWMFGERRVGARGASLLMVIGRALYATAAGRRRYD